MSKEMVISVNPHETRVAILEEGQLCEYYVEREREFALVGSIYKGRVTRVLPGMQSAFVEIGLDSDAFLYVSDFMEEVEDLDTVVSTAEEKIQKIEDQGGRAFAEGHARSRARTSGRRACFEADAQRLRATDFAERQLYPKLRPAIRKDRAISNRSPARAFRPRCRAKRARRLRHSGQGRPRFGDRGGSRRSRLPDVC